MTALNVWMLSGQVLMWGTNVLWQVTLISSIALLASRCWPRIPAVRHGILGGSLILLLLTPGSSFVMQQSRHTLFAMSLFYDNEQQVFDERGLVNSEAEISPSNRLERMVLPHGSDSLERHSLRVDDSDVGQSNPGTDALAIGRPNLLHPDSARRESALNQREILIHGPISTLRRFISAFLMVWICGAAILLLRTAIRWYRVIRILKATQCAVSPQVQSIFAEACQKLHISRQPVLTTSGSLKSPVAVGIWRHWIVLPSIVIDGWNHDQLRQILIHELAHVARRDPSVGLLQSVAGAIFWLHPLVHFLNRQLAKTREEICDNHVLTFADAANYCRTLLMVAESTAKLRPIAGSVGLLTSRWKLESRIAGLLDHRRCVMTRMTKRGHFMVGTLSILMLMIAAGGTISVKSLDSTIAAAEPDKPPATSSTNTVLKLEQPLVEDNENVIGIVVSEDGNPVAHFPVEITRQDGHRDKTILTDDHGRFRTPRKYWTEPVYGNELFIAVANDQRGRLGWFQIPSSGTKRMTSDGAELPNPEPQPFTIRLLPVDRLVTGQIVGPNQEPLEKVRIQAVRLKSSTNGDVNLYRFELSTELPLPSAITDEFGRFRISLPRDVGVTLNALHPNWIVKNISVADDNLGAIALRPSAKLGGKVAMGDSGKPAVGILIHAYCHNAIRRRQMEQNFRKPVPDADLGMDGYCVTNTEGRYEIGGLREEPHYVQVDTRVLDRDYVAPYGEVDVTTGETKTVDLTISKGRRVSGRVIEVESGEPIPGVEVFSNVTREAQPRWSFGNGFHATNEQGEFEFFALPGHAALNASVNPDHWKTIPESRTELDIVPDQDPEPVELKLQRAEIGQLRPRAIHTLHVGENHISAFVFDPESKTIITGGARVDERIENVQERWKAARGDIRVWDVASGQEIGGFGDEPGRVTDLAISADGKTIVTGIRLPDDTDLVRIWNVETREPRLTLTGHKEAVLSVDISSDGRFVAASSSDRTARIWNAITGEHVFSLQHDWSPDKLRFSPDGKLLATSGGKGKVKFWDVETGIERAKLDAGNCWIRGLSWSPTGKILAIACTPFNDDGKTISSETPGRILLSDVANIPSRTLIRERKSWNGQYHPSDITFSPNGEFLADARHTASVWQVSTGKEVAIIRQSTSSSGDRIRFSPNGKILALGIGQSITLWDVGGLGTAVEVK